MFYTKRLKAQFIPTALILTILLAAGFTNANPTSEKEAIYKAGLNYIEGFYTGDSAMLKASLSPNLKKFGFWKDAKTGKFGEANWMKYEEALSYADEVKEKKNFAKPDAPKKVEVIDYTSKIASVKISAWWGVDYMLLSKHGETWMIDEVIWEGPSLESNATEEDHAALKRGGLNYIEGFYEGDASKLQATLKPDMFKFGYGIDKETGEYREGSQMTFDQAIDYTKRVRENKRFTGPDAPKKVEVLGVMNVIALIKVTANWGVDYILMAKTGDKWMIEQVLWAGVPAT